MCLTPFPSGKYFEHCGSVLCEQDYQQLFGHRCAKCCEVILGAHITAMELKWHKEHFRCSHCDRPLSSAFVKMGKRPYCQSCHAELLVHASDKACEVCGTCRGPIRDLSEATNHEGAMHHVDCLKCWTCLQPLKPNYKEWDGKLYCYNDYLKVMASVCGACKKPIKGLVVEAMGKVFHPEHFVCCVCETPIKAGSFYEYRGRAYCEGHYNEIVGGFCLRCGVVAAGNTKHFEALIFCEDHFLCTGCDAPLGLEKSGKCFEWLCRPYCKACFDCIPAQAVKAYLGYKRLEEKLQSKAA